MITMDSGKYDLSKIATFRKSNNGDWLSEFKEISDF